MRSDGLLNFTRLDLVLEESPQELEFQEFRPLLKFEAKLTPLPEEAGQEFAVAADLLEERGFDTVARFLRAYQATFATIGRVSPPAPPRS